MATSLVKQSFDRFFFSQAVEQLEKTEGSLNALKILEDAISKETFRTLENFINKAIESDSYLRMRIVMAHPDFFAIFNDAAFIRAVREGKCQVIQAMIDDPKQFQKVSAKILSLEIGSAISRYDAPSIAIVRLLLHSERYKDIEADTLGEVLRQSCSKGDTETIKILIDSERFQEISQDNLGWALRLASDANHPEIALMLSNSARFHEIPLRSFKSALECASEKGYTKIVWILINSGRLQELSSEEIRIAIEKAGNNQEIVQALRSFIPK